MFSIESLFRVPFRIVVNNEVMEVLKIVDVQIDFNKSTLDCEF